MRPLGQVLIAAGVAVFGVFFFAGSFLIPPGGGYSTVGPEVMPRIVGAGLLLAAALLLREALTGGFRDFDEAAQRALPTDWRAFALVSSGIVAYGLLIERAGFVIASIALYLLVARGFGSRRWALNAVVGAVLAVGVYLMFNYGLGLTLPRGVLPF
ncbi:MAG TPA: tripartite tricarboxylate transporter TctB family protein [Burkholderiaceae bacterium]|nr:tripartite tricarboxylate transporter TctB family protein [Burkholderiaceae bacterium]